MKMMARSWKRDCCAVVEGGFDMDLHHFEVWGLDGEFLGEITPGDIPNYGECVTKLNAGDCPICSGWDDGLGNSCSREGWGEREYVTEWPELNEDS